MSFSYVQVRVETSGVSYTGILYPRVESASSGPGYKAIRMTGGCMALQLHVCGGREVSVLIDRVSKQPPPNARPLCRETLPRRVSEGLLTDSDILVQLFQFQFQFKRRLRRTFLESS